jgi:hypothetical protein
MPPVLIPEALTTAAASAESLRYGRIGANSIASAPFV